MSKLIFLNNPSVVYDVNFTQIGANQIRLIFQFEMPSQNILLSGLRLVNEYNGHIQTRREDYKYIYRSYDDNPLMIELCNDGIEYIEPKLYVPTEEEIAEQERQNQIQELNSQISTLKEQLNSSDYKIIKSYEYTLANKEIEYDMDALCDERQEIRNQINALENELNELYITTENVNSPQESIENEE